MKIMLTGRNGQVGWELERSLSPVGEVVACDRTTLDLTQPEQIISRVRDINPDVIVNSAAYTAVDLAENEPDTAMEVNGVAPGVLAEEAKRIGCLLVHYSTDYVFDGTKGSPYIEEDQPNPINEYGKTKLAGERAVQEVGCRHLVLRTAWVYSNRGKNFVLTMLRLMKEKSELRVVGDQRGAPTSARSIAAATTRILDARSETEGIFHLTAAGETTWAGFASEIARIKGGHIPVLPIGSSEYPVAATRPANSLLSNTKLQRAFGIKMADWLTGLHECLARLDGEPARAE